MLENTKLVVFPVCDLVKIWCEGKFERLITKTNLDRKLAMILAANCCFLLILVRNLMSNL